MRSSRNPRRSTFDLRLYAALFLAVLLIMAVGFTAYSIVPLMTVVVLIVAGAGMALGTRAVLEGMVRGTNNTAEWARRRNMLQRRVRIGMAEAALVLFAALLIAGEVFAIVNGVGPFFAIVSLGYFMAAGAAYLVYKSVTTERAASASEQTVAMESAPGPEARAMPGDGTAESHAAARQSDLLRRLTEEQAEAVLSVSRWTSVPAGARVAEAGADGDNVYIIIDGQVELTGRSDVGEVTVRVAGPGESFPLAALLGNGTLVTSATAMSDLLVYCVPRKQLMDLCAARPDIGMIVYAQVAEILADRYRSTLARHMTGVGVAVRQPDMWANV